jgi:trehalose 6-phosphate phosphatase
VPLSLPRARTPEGQAGLDALLAAPGRALIASDFDGTLSPIVPDPAAAWAYPGTAATLASLAPLVGTVAIITGRPTAEAVALGGFSDVPGLIVLGHYGAERWEAGTVTAAPVPAGLAEARRLLPGIIGPGVRIEDKGTALAVHTRQAPDPPAALAALRQPLERLAGQTRLALEPGRLVLELRAPGMDKGGALRALATERKARSVLFCGDDLGDLAAFAAVRALREEGIPGCVVASATPEAPQVAEAADLVVNGPAGVVGLLGELLASIASEPE